MSIPKEIEFSLAAAHNITSAVAATWDSSLRRTPRVLVPVYLEALVVRQAGGRWASCEMQLPPDETPAPPSETPTPDEADGTIDGLKLMPEPFTELAGGRRRGVYLHWALPDAITRGQQPSAPADGTAPASPEFPAIPDRWLVLRLSPGAVPHRRAVRGWVLQAGEAHPEPVELSSWREAGGTPDGQKGALTALGHGHVSWSAYFDNVKNRLAFYDDLADVTSGPLAYLVCGWYSDTTLDPLGEARVHSLTDFERRMAELRWSVPDKDFHTAEAESARHQVAAKAAGLPIEPKLKDRLRASEPFDVRMDVNVATKSEGSPFISQPNWWPEHTLYHGSVLGIGWPGVGWPGNEAGALSGEINGPPAAESVNVAVGNTIPEALARILSEAGGTARDARVLEAFQLGVLSDLNEPDGVARVDALLHASSFGSLPGGETTERILQPASGPVTEPPKNPAQPAPGIFERYRHTRPTRGDLGDAVFAERKDIKANARITTDVFQSKAVTNETEVKTGKLGSVLDLINPTVKEVPHTSRWIDVNRPLPRLFYPTDPVILLQGLRRSFQYGGDGRFSPDGTLQCRLTGACVREYNRPGRVIHPSDILEHFVQNGSVPPECDELLGEVALLDPGSAAPVVDSARPATPTTPALSPAARTAETRRVMTEQTAVWALRDPRIDHGPLVARLGFSGTLPSPIGLTPPVHPWSPIHLEWQIEFTPSPDGRKDWELGELDYNEAVPELPPAEGAVGVITLEGRTPLTPGVNKTVADAMRKTLEQITRSGGSTTISGNVAKAFVSSASQKLMNQLNRLKINATPGGFGTIDRSPLEDIATALESMDVLTATFGGLNTKLRGNIPGDGESTTPVGTDVAGPCIVMRAGFLRILRLRLVDGFGQFVDLAGSDAATPAQPSLILKSEPMEVTERPELLALPPRFTSPARLWFRFMDAAGGDVEASLASDLAPGVSPVCGFLMPNHLDRALEFFDVDGANLGVIRPSLGVIPPGNDDEDSIIWEDAPGRPATVGQSPARAIPNRFLGAIGSALIDWGTIDAGLIPGPDTALEGLLRVIDSTLWGIDPFGHQGDEHFSLLVGHPMVVLRALLRLDLNDPVDPARANLEKVPVSLGSLATWQDGLLGFFVNDDYQRFYCAGEAAAALAREIGPNRGFLQQANATQEFFDTFGDDLPGDGSDGNTPVQHPYIDRSGVIFVQPNQDVRLTLLVEPHTLVHATTGVLPRKEIAMRREWVRDALAKLAPTFRFGPVLIDPKRIRMPIPHDINGTWSWDHRSDVNTWTNDPVMHATQDALLPPDPPVGSEGWLRLSPPDEKEGGA
jgi:hypothetical protein